VFEIEGKPDRVSDRIGTPSLKENPRGADVACDAGAIAQLHRPRELKALPFPSLLKTANSSHSAAEDAIDAG
jgi:hypothetical protein